MGLRRPAKPPDTFERVTINGGGDGETRPKSYAVNYFIKIN
jgi:hypothetical protein